jgi:DNA ligase-1
MLASPLEPEELSALSYRTRTWLAQPKFDGCRALWDGQRIHSRSGKPTIKLHPEVQAELLKYFFGVPLDGELYNHGNDFEQNVSGARTGKEMCYHVFDMPTSEGFQDRLTHLRTLFSGLDLKNIRLAETVQLTSEDVTGPTGYLQAFVGSGYEGIILRDPNARYEYKRSHGLIKIKPWRTLEAVVIGVEPGKGKHLFRIGALRVQERADDAAACKFDCMVGTGLSDSDREHPLDWWLLRGVTIGYQELTRYGTPRFPRLLKIGEKVST